MGAVGSVVVDNAPGSAASTSPMFAMSGDGTDDVDIPVVFLFSQDAWTLLQTLAQEPATIVTLSGSSSGTYLMFFPLKLKLNFMWLRLKQHYNFERTNSSCCQFLTKTYVTS